VCHIFVIKRKRVLTKDREVKEIKIVLRIMLGIKIEEKKKKKLYEKKFL